MPEQLILPVAAGAALIVIIFGTLAMFSRFYRQVEQGRALIVNTVSKEPVVAFTGTMLSFGGGLQYLLSPKLALDGGVELGLGTFDHYDVDGDIGSVNANASTSIRVRAGFVWRP